MPAPGTVTGLESPLTAPKSYFSFGKGGAKAGSPPRRLLDGGSTAHIITAGRAPQASSGAVVATSASGMMDFG